MNIPFLRRNAAAAAALTLALALTFAAGCKHEAPVAAPPTDMQIAGGIQTKLSGEQALNGQEIHVAVVNGVATLSGTVDSDAARALAGNETGTIAGVKTVVNNLTVQAASAQPQQAAAPEAAPIAKIPARPQHKQAAVSQAPPPPPIHQPAPVQQAAVQPPPPPPAPPKPIVKQVTIAAGTVVPVRITEILDTKTTQTNDAFHASLAGDLMADGVVAIPRGAPVLGRVVDAKEAAHFKGNAALTLELTEMTTRGQRLTLVTESISQQGAGRGKNTAAKAGGGAALGAIIGALAGGGKGAAIGGLAGAGAGTGINAATRGQQVVIPSETLLNFRLQSPITVTVTIRPHGGEQAEPPYQPTLQQR